jgi:ubiquinone/menaquinone biosynthesis C-methylase UbiE
MQSSSMKSRGETQFLNFPRFAAGLYSRLTGTRSLKQQYREIATHLMSHLHGGRLLDVGTGPGRLLLELHRQAPGLQLSGLDISSAMVALARRNLEGISGDIRQASVCATGYEDDFFDLVVCSGSFYLWDQPEQGLDEIYRILKPGGSAHLFETNRDYDRKAYKAALKMNLKQEGLAMRLLGPFFLAKALSMAYRPAEVEDIVARTKFAGNCPIENIALVDLPTWMHIQLGKGVTR